MAEDMNISVNGQSQVPPGFRFHPTEEELLQYYLRKKVSHEKIDLDVIRDADLNKLEPWDIQGTFKIGTTPQTDWYFFSHKDKKYPTGSRTNRATGAGFWKATGRDKVIHSNCRRRIGLRKTLVFYEGRAPHGQKSDWIMYEYRFDDYDMARELTEEEEGWVICKMFRKKYRPKTLDRTPDYKGPRESFFLDPRDEFGGGLEQIIFQHQGRNSKGENENESTVERGGSPTLSIDTGLRNTIGHYHERYSKLQHVESAVDSSCSSGGLTNWPEVENLIASLFNGGQVDESYSEQLACFNFEQTLAAYSSSRAACQDHGHLQFPTGTSSSQSVDYRTATMGYDSESGFWIFDEA